MARLLGEILVSAKVINGRQLDEAISNQVVYGGRLGTNLMDLGFITENVLANHLSAQTGLPTIAPQAYYKIHRNIAKVLPKKTAEHAMAVPLVVKDKTLHVVMADPKNVAAQDEIRFATGYKLQVYVAPEVRVFFLLNRLYGTRRDVRYVIFSLGNDMSLRSENALMSRPKETAPKAKEEKVLSLSGLETASHTGDLMSEAEFEQLTQDVGMGGMEGQAGEPDDVLLGEVADDESEVLVLGEEVEPALEPRHPASEAVMATPPASEPVIDEAVPMRRLTLAQATKALEHVEDRNQLARVVLGFASGTFKRSALFMVRSGMVMGWDGTGGDIGRETIERLMIPLNVASVFKTVCDMQAHFLGPIPKSAVNGRFLKALGGDPPRSAFVIPILFKGKIVNILYGDNGPGADASYDIGELLILAMKIPKSFEDLVLRAKQSAAS